MISLKFLGLAALAVFPIATPTAPAARQPPARLGGCLPVRGGIIESLSLPGFQFRRAEPFRAQPVQRKVQNYVGLKRLSRDRAPYAQHSTVSLLRQVQRDNGGAAYQNVTAVDRYAVQYAAEVVFNGVPTTVVVDSGSADTWIRGPNFACLSPSNPLSNSTLPADACGLGPSPVGNLSVQQIPDQHFVIKYGDGESVKGRLGYLNVEFAGVSVPDQEVAIVNQAAWRGNSVTSGILGLAYPSLTSAYWGDDLDNDNQYLVAPYSPLFTSMIVNGLVEPYWSLALYRNSSLGTVSVGGMPPVDLGGSEHASTPIIIADIIHRDITAYKPSFYTLIPDGIEYGSTRTKGQYPFILDSATSLIYLPPALAQSVNAHFDPPATYLRYYDSYFANCDAVPPSFGVRINGTTFWVNPEDLLNQEEKDPETGLCQTSIGSGGSGPYILGIAFLTNVVVQMDIGSGNINLWSHDTH
ncbi:acid protease [Durotheca rogersii]|uniref:acid protease n=1 Tax=Durotheca rogersii TaxID=419775 RepID=UPI00221FC665|nr:acid protease [Durotheca rogersii]KAI5864102.1 acid protease [Durotheca rogersii]